jgi:hypothetical protein
MNKRRYSEADGRIRKGKVYKSPSSFELLPTPPEDPSLKLVRGLRSTSVSRICQEREKVSLIEELGTTRKKEGAAPPSSGPRR